MFQIWNDVKMKFRLLTSMEQILIPNFSLSYLYSNGMNSLKSLFEREKGVDINKIEQAIFFSELLSHVAVVF